MKKTHVELEILRTLSFVAVFNQHVLGAAARRNEGLLPIKMEWVISFLFELSRFAVPAFVFMFGLLMVITYKENTKYTDFLKRRFKQIYVPYLIATVVYIAYDIYRFQEEIGLMALGKTTLEKILLGNGFYHLWYIPMIFQFVIFAPILFAVIRIIRSNKIDQKKQMVFFSAFIVLCFVYLTIMPKLDLPVFIKTNYTRLFPTWLFYFGIGAACGLNYERVKVHIKRFFPVAAVIAIAAIAFAFYKDVQYIAINQKVHFNQVSFLEPVYAVLTVIEIFALIGFADLIKRSNLVSKVSLMMGANSFTAYLLHALIISIVSMQIAGFQPDLNLTIFYMILYPVALVLTVFLSALINGATKHVRRTPIKQS